MTVLIKAGMDISYIWDKFFIYSIIVFSLFLEAFCLKS